MANEKQFAIGGTFIEAPAQQAENKKNLQQAKIKRNVLLGGGVAALGYSAYKMENKKEFFIPLAIGLYSFAAMFGGSASISKTAETLLPFSFIGAPVYILTRGALQKSTKTSLIVAASASLLFIAYQHYLEKNRLF